jgi:hypothetical protein
VSVWSKVAVPVIVTVPERAGVDAAAVLKFAAALAADTVCVAVSFRRCVKLYDVPAVNPLNVGLSCHEPLASLYSALLTVVSVMLLAVLLAIVGAAGVVCAAFATAAVADEVTLPVQLLADTTTLIVAPTSAAANL